MEDHAELLKHLANKIISAHHLIERLKLLRNVEGVDKLTRKIQQEIRFLEKVQNNGNVKKEHLQSTNLIHLDAIINYILNYIFSYKQVTHLLKSFKYQHIRLAIDIVCNNGASWIKVIARNAKALTLISLGNGEYGQKSIIDQADSFLKCATHNPFMYQAPKIIFYFAQGIEIPLATQLESMGVVVQGQRMLPPVTNVTTPPVYEELLKPNWSNKKLSRTETEEEITSGSYDVLSKVEMNSSQVNLLNLDVSTLLAYVSNMTNGYAYFIYREPLLTQQAEYERVQPVKPILDQLFKGKDLIVCRTAYDNFKDIIDIIGGVKETERAEELLKRVQVVDDSLTGRIMENLAVGGKIKDRSKKVFAIGENLKSITVTANEGFVRAARMQGIDCMVFLHQPRSLSEVKEGYAKHIGLL
ncbi:UPF0415 protein C7orf25 homolog isoform X2 [Prorops nasuta]|uniref:UPF0415 protein C7orf25 homolog isoform X2 n=1 Tax=Prorops nasuta TaxID=863751 RepID=UPI0034CD1FE0